MLIIRSNEFDRKKDISYWRKWLCRQLLRCEIIKTICNRICYESVLHEKYSKGIKYDFPQNRRIDWLVADVSNPGKYVEDIKSADIIVHTIGTLIDSSVLKGTPPGGPGTYEQVNRDTFRDLLGYLDTPKKIIYLSSNAHPPFL